MISFKYKFIYIHINCCGGSSVEKVFSDYGESRPRIDPGISPIVPHTQHLNAQETRLAFGEKIWNKFFTFTFVRNPWDRIVSYYMTHPLINEKMSFKEFLRKEEHSDYKRMYGPCFDWISDEKGNLINFNYIGKKESLQTDFKKICQKLNIKGNLPYINITRGKWPYQYYYDNESKNIVAKRFVKDIENFEYEFIELEKKFYMIKKPLFVSVQAKKKLGNLIRKRIPRLYYVKEKLKIFIKGFFKRKNH